MQKLAEKEIQESLTRVPSWELKEGGLSRVFSFADFKEAMLFVNKMAEMAEKAAHHPDISISYNKVDLTLWTHSAGGLTEKDFSLAEKIDQI